LDRRATLLVAALLLILNFKLGAQVIDTVCTTSINVGYQVPKTLGSNYYWTLEGGGALTSGQGTEQIRVNWGANPGLYSLKVIEQTGGGCWGDTAIAKVLLIDKFPIQVFGPETLCKGDPAVFSGIGQGTFYWYNGQIGNPITFKGDSATLIYAVSKIGSCWSDTSYKFVRVFDKPDAQVKYDFSEWQINNDLKFFFTGNNTTRLIWRVNGITIKDGFENPFIYNAQDSGNLEVTLIAENSAGCTDSILIKGYVYDKFRAFLPNAFTPNNDGLNDNFSMFSYGYAKARIMIFNRSHMLLYDYSGVDFAWDGTFNGEPLTPGAYHYVLELEDFIGGTKVIKDIVTLMR
jgi:gliding motility-associated-like protein